MKYSDINPLYNILELSRFQLAPYRTKLILYKYIMEYPFNFFSSTDFGKYYLASLELMERITRKYEKPEFNIKHIKIDDKDYKIEEIVEITNPFCKLLHFKKIDFDKKLPKMLVIAPMSGHHSTLLKGTVNAILPYFDVYITDWIDACQVPLLFGKFDIDDYIDYLIEFMRYFHNDSLHIMAVCQPTIQALAATAIMCKENISTPPNSLILMGGPIDSRVNPTELNNFASENTLEWFENSVITKVPANYPGSGRKVYPGFLQLAGFMSLNWKKHLGAHMELFKNIVSSNHEQTEIHKKFYDEYFSVMDLPAEFFLNTIDQVFHKFSLPEGKLYSKGRDANVTHIKNIPIFGIEGEKDDIAAVGQTKVIMELCDNVPNDMKHYHLQESVGHYGVFSGSKFKKYILPKIVDFVYKYNE